MKYIKHAEVEQPYSKAVSQFKIRLDVETKLSMELKSYTTKQLKTSLIRDACHER